MIIAVTGITNIGQTFMDWSIHFLAGADKYWRADTKSDFFARWRPLSHDPLNSESAHGHKKGSPGWHEKEWEKEYRYYIKLAREQEYEHPITIYPHISPRVGLDMMPEIKRSVEVLKEEGVRIIYLNQTNFFPIFMERCRQPYEFDPKMDIKLLLNRQSLPSDREIRKELSYKIYKMKIDILNDYAQLAKSVEGIADLIITDKAWHSNPADTVKMVFDKLGLDIDQSRWSQWEMISKKWQGIQKELYDFHNIKLPAVAKAIVEGTDAEWPNKWMDMVQESLIMYWIMKNHKKRLILPDDNFPYDSKFLHKYITD